MVACFGSGWAHDLIITYESEVQDHEPFKLTYALTESELVFPTEQVSIPFENIAATKYRIYDYIVASIDTYLARCMESDLHYNTCQVADGVDRALASPEFNDIIEWYDHLEDIHDADYGNSGTYILNLTSGGHIELEYSVDPSGNTVELMAYDKSYGSAPCDSEGHEVSRLLHNYFTKKKRRL
jgi:hypothetical protein